MPVGPLVRQPSGRRGGRLVPLAVMVAVALPVWYTPAWAFPGAAVPTESQHALADAPLAGSDGDDPAQAVQVDTLQVAGQTLMIPRPAGFVRPDTRLQAGYDALGLGRAGTQEPLLLLVPQALDQTLMLHAAVAAARRSMAADPQLWPAAGASGPPDRQALLPAQRLPSSLQTPGPGRADAPVPGPDGGADDAAEDVPAVVRHLVIKTPGMLRLQQMSAGEFQVFRRHVQEDHQRLLQAQPPWPTGWGMPNRLTTTAGTIPATGVALDAGAMRAAMAQGRWLLPVHADDPQMLAYSAIHVLGQERGGGLRLQAQTLAMLHVGGRLLFLQANGRADDLAWTQALMQRWVADIRRYNPVDEPGVGTAAEARRVDAVQRAVQAANELVATLDDTAEAVPPDAAITDALEAAVARAMAASSSVSPELPVSPPAAAPLPAQDLAPVVQPPSERLTSTVLARLLAALACGALLWWWVQLRLSRRTM